MLRARPACHKSILSPGQGLRTRAKRTTGKQGLRYTPYISYLYLYLNLRLPERLTHCACKWRRGPWGPVERTVS